MKDEKYDMVLAGDRYSDSWIIYPTGGNYIHDKICELPGGSKVTNEAAHKVLEAMNS